MMRFGDKRCPGVRVSDSDADARRPVVGDNEKFAKGDIGAALTTPVTVAPLLGRKATDMPGTCALVTVTTCVPGVADNVHFTDDLPSPSLVVAVADNVPPPVGVHVSGTFATEFPRPSSTCTTSAESSVADTSADWFAPETILRCVGAFETSSPLQPEM